MLKIKEAFMNQSLHVKNLIFLASILIFSTLFLMFIVFSYSSRIIIGQSNRYSDELLNQTSNYLNEKLRYTIMQLTTLQLDERFVDTILRVQKGEMQDPNEISMISDMLVRMKNFDDLIDSIYVYAGDYFFFNFNSVLMPRVEFPQTKLYRQTSGLERIFWGVSGENELFRGNTAVIPVVMPVVLGGQSSTGYYIVVNIRSDAIQSILDEIADSLESRVFILNQEREIVLQDGLFINDFYIEQIFQGQYFSEINGEYQLALQELGINHWSIGVITENRVLLREVNHLAYLFIIVAFANIFIFGFMGNKLTKTITKPIGKLTALMVEASENDYMTRFEPLYKDEVGQLGRGFNMMSEQINQQLGLIMKEQKQKRMAELQALNANINPHFLYNTLDCIYWTSLKNQDSVVADIALNMSVMYRLGLNRGEEITTVQNEINHVTAYLKIQKMLYPQKFSYTISSGLKMEELISLKLLLQPIVENSIIHGFKNMEKDGQIDISISSVDGKIVYSIADNGGGLQYNHVEQGYALRNIQERLALYYDEKAFFEIANIESQGVRVTIGFPAVVKEEDHV